MDEGTELCRYDFKGSPLLSSSSPGQYTQWVAPNSRSVHKSMNEIKISAFQKEGGDIKFSGPIHFSELQNINISGSHITYNRPPHTFK